MIVVSFFSAKGGTGKTTFNMSMASFLKYHLGKAVIMLDADTPEYNLYNSRVRELDYKRANGGIDESALYPVGCIAWQRGLCPNRLPGFLRER